MIIRKKKHESDNNKINYKRKFSNSKNDLNNDFNDNDIDIRYSGLHYHNNSNDNLNISILNDDHYCYFY